VEGRAARRGYALSSWAERVAIESAARVVAVSAGMRRDVLAAYPGVDPDRVTVVHNGIDTEVYAPDTRTDALVRAGVDPDRPSVVFVGRITRQKGPAVPLARRPLARPVGAARALRGRARHAGDRGRGERPRRRLRRERGNVVWIEQMLPRPDVVQILTHATVFVCPSVYEPMGIVNLEAMACRGGVVATATGGIPEVVADGETGLLVPIEQATDGTGTPLDPDRFAADLADRLNALVGDPERARGMGLAGRRGRSSTSRGRRSPSGRWRSTEPPWPGT
jgi:starch synthase